MNNLKTTDSDPGVSPEQEVDQGDHADHDLPPELPPRPLHLLSLSPRPPPPHAPPYTSNIQQCQPGSNPGPAAGNLSHTCSLESPWYSVLLQKYVILTIISGTLSVILGSLFITIYFIVRNTTTSLHYFETLPTYIPGIAMTCTGVLVMLFSKTSNRKSCLVKFCGCFCLLSALLCVVVTVTTTVVHMNRLQTLRECVYQASTKTCTCFAGMLDHRSIDHDATLRYVFAAAPNCEVIHGTIYSCLRAMFGLSVIGILVSIFSCMLVYQILSHEKKKKYLAELNSRCRSLYQRPGLGQYGSCQYPWSLNSRLCSGNLYTPTPELSVSTISTILSTRPPGDQGTQGVGGPGGDGDGGGTGGGVSGGGGGPGWRWLPWSRKQCSSHGVGGSSGLVHSQSDSLGGLAPLRAQQRAARPPHWRYSHSDAVYGFRPPVSGAGGSVTNYSARMDLTNIDSLSNLLWGPPPPYSHPPSSVDSSPPPVPANSESPQRSQSRLSRTTKSGILMENSGDTASTGGGTAVDSPIHYDETVDSAMHIYEKLRRSRSGSLPSRRVKRSRQQGEKAPTTTSNLSALNLSRAEDLRTAQDLEEIKRALLALQQNSLGLLSNIQNSSQPGARGGKEVTGGTQGRQGILQPGRQRKARGVFSVSNEQLTKPGSKFSLPTTGGRRTISTTNLIASGTESDNSYAGISSVSASSRASSSLSSSGPQQVIRTQELPHINSSIIQTANKMMSGGQAGQAKLPLSLTGLLSPRHLTDHQRPALPLPPPARVGGLVSPARMYPSTFSPTPAKAKSGLVYLRQDQNIPDNFCDKFRPIQPAGEPSQSNKAGGGGSSVDIKNISSDDIVVTLHSVNV